MNANRQLSLDALGLDLNSRFTFLDWRNETIGIDPDGFVNRNKLGLAGEVALAAIGCFAEYQKASGLTWVRKDDLRGFHAELNDSFLGSALCCYGRSGGGHFDRLLLAGYLGHPRSDLVISRQGVS